MIMPMLSPPRATVKKDVNANEISVTPTACPAADISANVFIIVYSTTATPSAVELSHKVL